MRGWRSEKGMDYKVSAGLWGRIEMSCAPSVIVSVYTSAVIQVHHTIHRKMENSTA